MDSGYGKGIFGVFAVWLSDEKDSDPILLGRNLGERFFGQKILTVIGCSRSCRMPLSSET